MNSYCRCLACGGVYQPVQASGAYCHVCPPLVDPETLETTPRPGARNENRDPQTGAIKAEGEGRVELAPGGERRPAPVSATVPVTAVAGDSEPEPGKLSKLWARVTGKNA